MSPMLSKTITVSVLQPYYYYQWAVFLSVSIAAIVVCIIYSYIQYTYKVNYLVRLLEYSLLTKLWIINYCPEVT